MPLLKNDRVFGRLAVVILGEEHGRTKVNGPPPELGQHWALETETADELGVFGNCDRRYDVLCFQSDDTILGRIDANALDVAIDVSRRTIPVLPFPLVVVHP